MNPDSIYRYASMNAALIETWQTIVLEDILEREVIVESCYVLVERQTLKKKRMSLSM